MTKKLLVMAGGTGGHVFPGLAVADVLKKQGWQVVWMGNPDGMEARLVPQRGYDMAWVRFSALRGKGLLRKLLLPLNLLSGFWQALREIRRVKPDVVLGMGGYITFPGGMMAVLSGCPLVVHEQNSVAGLANRVLAKVADRVVTGFPDVLSGGEWVGNPVREDIASIPLPSARYSTRNSDDHEPLRLLVLGGSLGAAAINEAVPKGLALLPEDERPVVVHQAGEKHLATVDANYQEAGVKANCVPFIQDMANAYSWADLVICRSGALTVAEVAAAGVASVLVPFPFAVDDHQTFNAQFLEKAGAAKLMPQTQLTPENVRDICLLPRVQLRQMAEKARGLAKPESAHSVARVCEALANRQKG